MSMLEALDQTCASPDVAVNSCQGVGPKTRIELPRIFPGFLPQTKNYSGHFQLERGVILQLGEGQNVGRDHQDPHSADALG